MFKPARWWSDKNKLKVVFKLQFHASQVTQDGGDGLMISVVPADTGKPTVKSSKAAARDGSCLWENPIYETVKFNQDPKSGKIHERLYYFVVGTGSSKSGFLGEASVDFSNYAEATKASLLSLPLKNSKSHAILHVSIERVQESVVEREIEEDGNENLYSEDQSLTLQLGNHETDGTMKISSAEDAPSEKTVCEAEFNTKRQGSSGSDLTLSSCGGSSGIEAPWELKNEIIHQEWLANSGLEDSTDDSSSTPREAFLGDHSEEAPDIVIEKLKADVAALSRQAEMSDLELQSLRKQVVKESKRGQDLWREVVCLKEERDALKGESEQLKAVTTKTNFLQDRMDSRAMVEELRQELHHAKELNTNLRIQLEKTQESNSELILAVQDLEEMLEQKNGEKDMDEKSREVVPPYRPDYDDEDDDGEQKALEDLVKEHNDAKETSLLEQQIMDLRSEIEIYKRDKDELEMQMEALALDYEIMKQANHEMSYKLEQSQIQEQLNMQYECSSPDIAGHELETHVDNLQNELEIRSQEYENSLVVISELQAHAKSLEEELEQQAHGFEADLEAVTQSKIEQEQRAMRAEETLKKIRWRNANTAERLQEEFRKLSVQMASSFEANEKLATNAIAEANELRLQKSHLEEMLRQSSVEHQSVEDHYETRLQQLSSQVKLMSNQIEQMQLAIEDREVQLEHQRKHAEDTQRVLSNEILMLKDEIETHIAKNKILLEEMGSKKALMHELDTMRILIKEMELLVEQGNDEKTELESKVLLVKTEAEELHKELNKMKSLVKEKELTAGNLQSELDSLQGQCMKLKNSLLKDEVEKEELRKQVLQLRSDLKKKEDCMEKKTKDGRGRATTLDAVKATSKTSNTRPRESKEIANLKERIKVLENQIKLKETALETSANAFLEKDKDLHHKIEELKDNLELKQTSAQSCEKLAAEVVEDQSPNCRLSEEAENTDENLSTRRKISTVNHQEILSTKSNDLSEVRKDSSNPAADAELQNEMASLKERNKSMERDLKEMQERYLDISLKFAEVEGERQQLVMNLRNLTNASKSL